MTNVGDLDGYFKNVFRNSNDGQFICNFRGLFNVGGRYLDVNLVVSLFIFHNAYIITEVDI